MSQGYVFHCKGYFEGELHNLALFDNEDAASDFCIHNEGVTYVDLYYEKIPFYTSFQSYLDV